MAPLLIYLFDLFGVFVFAISGALLAVRKKMDLFGVCVLALLPAIGGGTLRDLFLDRPLVWMSDQTVLGVALAGALTTFFWPSHIPKRLLAWFDAIGLSLFTVSGTAIAHAAGLPMAPCLILGVMTATFGGLMRDVIANEDPMLLHTDIYATAALGGALAFLAVISWTQSLWAASAVGFVTAFAIRSGALMFKWSLPRPK